MTRTVISRKRLLRLSLIFVCTLLLLTRPVNVQEKRAGDIMTFDEYARLSYHSVPYILEFHTGKGGLFYFGARHISDPTHAQVSQLEKMWQAFRPDVAFFEGRDPENTAPLEPGTREESVSGGGESGFTIYLAVRDGVPARTLEPARREEIALLLKQYTAEQVKLFYVLRQIPQFRSRRQEQTIERYAENDLGGMSLRPGLEGPPRTLAEFTASVARLFPELKDWREVPQAWFDPAPPKPQTYLNAVSRRLSEFRDRHMVKLLVDEVRQGRRVFAVVGSSHVVMQEPALRAAFAAR